MARIEKTVFISYRRTDVYTALAVYENLKNQGYDVFFDYRSISSGDFEQIITSNIRARAHFLLILTPTALDRCSEPGDWLRREIEIAIDEKRNIVPLFFKGFRFGTPAVSESLTGKLKNLSRYNGLNVHEDYFEEAMQRVRTQFLNIPLDTVLHPVSTEVRKVVREEQLAADMALDQIEDVQELVKQPPVKLNESNGGSYARPVEIPKEERGEEKKIESQERLSQLSVEEGGRAEAIREKQPRDMPAKRKALLNPRLRLLIGVASVLIGVPLCIMAGVNYSINNLFEFVTVTATSSPTNAVSTSQPTIINTPTPTETSIPPTPTLGSTLTGKDDMTLLYVPAAEFTMGSDNGEADEKPVHTVYLGDFWIDQTEVTNAMYAKCVQDGKCNQPSDTTRYDDSNYTNHPVVFVSWNDAKTYCTWADRRLPTEAEWEKAARGDDARTYPWGNGAPNNNLSNYNNAIGDTTEVGKYPDGASPYGALDMAGNVWEWVADWHSYTYYASSPTSNPLGPDSGQYRVLRGGSFYRSGSDMRSADRRRFVPAGTSGSFGFRCSRSP